jgi:hypothetical protein
MERFIDHLDRKWASYEILNFYFYIFHFDIKMVKWSILKNKYSFLN